MLVWFGKARNIFKRVLKFARWPFRLVGMLFSSLFGKLHWELPPWLDLIFIGFSAAFGWIKRNPRRTAKYGLITFVLLVAAGGAWYAYSRIPRPELITLDVTNPPRTQLESENPKPQPLVVEFSASAAPLKAVGKEVEGLHMSPGIPGHWFWRDDTTLEFDPGVDWPVGETVNVSFDKKLLAASVRLDKYSFDFQTAPFEMHIQSAEFFQDPVDPNQKKAIVEVDFSHPVDPEEFEKRVTLRMKGQSSGVLGIGGETTPFTVSYGKKKLTAFIHSALLPIPRKDSYLNVKVDSGVRAQSGGNGASEALEEQVAIPGLFSLNVDSANMTLVNNEHYEPEQVLMLETSATVREDDMNNRIEAWVLPVYNPETPVEKRKYPYYWSNVEQIGESVLKQSDKLQLNPIPAEQENTTTHSYKFEADAGRFIYVRVPKGLKSFGGYEMGDTYDAIIRVKQFPKEVRILHSGSLLPLSGDHKVPVLARDVDHLQYEIGRLLPGQIQHLVSQTSGQFGKPYFANSWNFNFDNLSERFTEVDDLPKLAPGKAQYTALDLGKYLNKGGVSKRGLFMVKVNAYDPVRKIALGSPDTRLIVLTDLGLLAKRAVDGSQDVFVQSIHDGSPVGGASVQVIGKNGLPVLTQESDANGHVHFPSLKDFRREQTPELYLVKKGSDMSFLPYERSDRVLDLSRFDVGGVSNSVQTDKLQGYLFSDRGLYRPGEEFKVGMIVRASDWSTQLAGIPLEMVISDARGLTVKRQRIKLPESGFMETAYTTQDTSPTGTWNVNLYIVKDNHAAGLIGSTSVKVQEFQPDRMKISAHFSQETTEGWVSPEDLKARVSLKNLFGTPAANRKVRASMTLYPSYPSFPSYKDYSFYDPQRAKHGFDDRLSDTQTDDNGEAEFDLRLERFTRATYRVLFTAQGFEAEGGRSVSAERSVLVSSMPYLVGFKSDGNLRYVNKDAKRSVQLIAINSKAKKTKVDGLKLVHIARKYVSVLTKQNSGVYKYESKMKEIVLSEKSFAIAAKGTSLALPTTEPGDYAMVIRDAKGQELNRIEYSVAGHANLTRSLEKNAELQIKLAKTDVAAGQDIELEIRAPYTGSGLITIERDKVYAWKWFKATATNTVQHIRVPAGLEGNGYVSVSFVRDINSPEVFMSPLSYGVAPFSVSLERHKNKISVSAPDLVKPGDVLHMKVRTEKPSRLVLFAVDEGILQVAEYKTPDPLGYFFQKRALETRTSQILDLILPGFKQLMASAPGGDAEAALGKHLNPFKRKHAKAVAFWSGIIDAGPKEKDVTYTVPDYFNGTLRIMAVAVSADTIGVLEKKALVRGDFVLSPNVPTQVAPGDEFDVSLGVANNIPDSGKGAPVHVALKTSPHLAVVGAATQDLKIDALHEGVARFHLRATDKLGAGMLHFVASYKDKRAKYSASTSVRPPVPYRVSLTFGNVKDGSIEQPVTRDMYDEYSKRSAGISTLPLIMGQGLTAYLAKNPYGCTEQLVSQAMPAMILQSRPEFGIARNVSEETLGHIISMLRSRQNQEGGFGLWAANHYVVPWTSVYAVHFLLEARDRGYAVPQDMLDSANNWLRQLAGSEGESLADERARAYAIYLLARQGMVVSRYAVTLQKRLETQHAKEWRGDITAAYLAATYELMRQEGLANDLISGVKPNHEPVVWQNYYDDLSHNAQLLYLLARHFPDELKKLDEDALESIARPIRENRYNTLSSAYTLLALDAYATATGKEATGKFSITEMLADGSKKQLKLPEGVMPRADFSHDAQKLKFSSGSDYLAYTVLNQSGFDRRLPKNEIKQEIEVFREYQDANGKPVTSVKLGDEVEVHLSIRAIGKYSLQNVAIVDLLPGGFEIVPESRADQSTAMANYNPGENEDDESSQWQPPVGTAKSNWHPSYADVREDRVVLYGSVDNSAQTFVYRIKATNAGNYTVPPTFAEGMYNRGVLARALGGKITVEGK